MSVSVTFSFGIVVRRSALEKLRLSVADVSRVLEVDAPMDADSELISFGPAFGRESCDEFVHRLQAQGLTYVDDFFDLAADHPEWLGFSASLRGQAAA